MTVHRQFDSRSRLPWTGLPSPVRVLLAARLVNRVGAFSMPFLAILLVEDHGASVRLAGLVVGAFGAATIPSRLLGGPLVAAVGSKRAVVTGLCGTAAAQLLVAVAPTLSAVLVGAVLLGLCFELYEPASQGLIADVTPDRLLPAAYGLLGATLAAAGVIAGLLAAAVGRVGLRWLFVVDAATALVCALVVAALLPATPRRRPDPTVRVAPWSDLRLLALMGTGTAFATVYLAIPMALPVALAAAGHRPSDAGLLEALGALALVAAQPALRDAAEPGRRMTAGYALLAGGLAVAGIAPTLAGYTVSTVVVALGDLLLLGHAYTLVARLAPTGAKAAYFSVYGTVWGVALTVGPPVMGLALSAGPRTFWWVAAVLMLATGLLHRVAAGWVTGADAGAPGDGRAAP